MIFELILFWQMRWGSPLSYVKILQKIANFPEAIGRCFTKICKNKTPRGVRDNLITPGGIHYGNTITKRLHLKYQRD